MSKLFRLLQINLISYFNFYKILNAKGGERIKEIGKFILLVALFALSGIYVYYFAKLTMKGFVLLNAEYIVLGEFFALSSIFSLFTTIFRVDGVLFDTKDYEMLVSMPIKKTTILTSKMLNLYLSNLFFTIVIMIPVLILYTKCVLVSFLFYILYLASILVIPLLPTVVAVVIGSVISFVSSRFRIKKAVQLTFMLVVMILSIYLSYNLQEASEFDIAHMSEGILNIFNKIYPLTNTYLKMVVNSDVFSICLFLALPVIIYALATLILSFYYTNIVTKIKGEENKKKYKVSHKANSKWKAVLKKEFKRYLSSPNYIMNSSSGIILMLIASIAICFIPTEKLEVFLGIQGIRELLCAKGPLIMGLMLMLCSTTSSSISLEGSSLWIMRSLPVDVETVFLGKISMNLLILMIPCFVITLIFHVIFQLGFWSFLMWVLLLFAYSLFVSLFGLIVNLCFPLLHWENEIKVIKQSMATFVSVIGGMIIGSIPLFIKIGVNTYIYLVVIGGVFLLLDCLLYFILVKYGKRLFLKLEV